MNYLMIFVCGEKKKMLFIVHHCYLLLFKKNK